MILRAICNSCYQRYEITGGLDMKTSTAMISQLTDEAGMGICPRQCGGKINLTNDATIDAVGEYLKEPLHLTVTELFQAIGGMPLPDEVPQSVETLTAMLLAHRAVGATMEDSNGRVYLHELKLDNGCTIHLCAGGRGAQVLKITRRPSESAP